VRYRHGHELITARILKVNTNVNFFFKKLFFVFMSLLTSTQKCEKWCGNVDDHLEGF
jgi:hypothetical protein